MVRCPSSPTGYMLMLSRCSFHQINKRERHAVREAVGRSIVGSFAVLFFLQKCPFELFSTAGAPALARSLSMLCLHCLDSFKFRRAVVHRGKDDRDLCISFTLRGRRLRREVQVEVLLVCLTDVGRVIRFNQSFIGLEQRGKETRRRELG